MSAVEIIEAVHQAGGTLRTSGGRLKVSATAPLPDVIDFLNRPVARVVLLHCPPGVPEEWVQGMADLLAMSRPASCPDAKWQTLREDAYAFLRDHAGRAHQLGWTALDLFGVHRVKPWARIDVMGLVPLLNGGRTVVLSDTEAVIEKPSGARVRFRRRGQMSTEVCLIWELET